MSQQAQEFQVLVSGGVMDGKDKAEVVDAFARLIKVDKAKAELFFQGKPRIIKKRTDQATATKFEKALTAIGAVTSVRPLAAPAGEAVTATAGLQLEPTEDEAANAGSETGTSPAKPSGPTMICPGCNTLQPRAEECPACGVIVEKARRAQEAQSEAAPQARESQRNEADSYGFKSVVAAAVAALLGALLWMGIAVGFDYELGLVAWLVGGAVGFAAAVTGGRGSSTGMMCAIMALCAIIGGKYLAYGHFQENISVIMEESGMWADEESQLWFEEVQVDAELYMQLDGSDEALREFIYDRSYTDAAALSLMTDEDVDYFLEVEAPILEWIAATDPSVEQWQQRVMSGISDLSTWDLVMENLGLLDLLFLFLGLSTAYRLGDEGLPG